MAFSAILTGDKQIDRQLKKLEVDMQTRIMIKAIEKPVKDLVPLVKANTPVKSGRLRDSIKAIRLRKSATRRRQQQIGWKVVTGTRKRLKIAPDDKYYYPAAVELGFFNKQYKKHVPPKSYLRKTLLDNETAVLKKVSVRLNKLLAITLRKKA